MTIEEFYDKRTLYINRVAKKDCKTNDSNYNKGLEEIRRFGYEHVSGSADAEYWRYCNNM